MTKPTQGHGPDGRPRCYNREPCANYLLQDGWEPGLSPSGTPTRYPVMVEYPFTMSPGCKAWESSAGTPSVPEAEGWKCEGCRWHEKQE